jgi:hypothetical protein
MRVGNITPIDMMQFFGDTKIRIERANPRCILEIWWRGSRRHQLFFTKRNREFLHGRILPWRSALAK